MPIMPSAARPCRLCHLVVFGIALLVSSPLKVRAVQEPPSPAETARLTATGGISAHTVGVDERVRIWLTVSNAASHSIYDVRLLVQLDPADYDIEGIYKWTALPGQPAASQQRLGPGREQLIADELKPGENIGVWAYFRPHTPHDTTTLNGLVSWRSVEGDPSQLFVTFGDLKVQGLWDRTYQLIKDFALPLVVLLLPFLIQQMAQKRAHLAETWNLMLPDSHHTTMTYYMPLGSPLNSALRDFVKWSDAPNPGQKKEEARAIFFHLMLFRRRLKHAMEKLGGYYFKDRVGERLAAASARGFQDKYEGNDETSKKENAKILKHIGIHETLDTFLEKLDGDPSNPKISRVSALFKGPWEHFFGSPTSANVKPLLESEEFKEAILCLKAFLGDHRL